MTEFTDLFISESKKYVKEIYEDIDILEKDRDNKNIVHEMYMMVHSLKGMSGMMEFFDMYEYLHKLENTLNEIKVSERPVSDALILRLKNGIHTFEEMLQVVIDKRNRMKKTIVKDKISVETLFAKISKMAKDLAVKDGKEVKVSTVSNIDKISLVKANSIIDILIQLVRNAVAHGIETPDERVAVGKSREGNIAIEIIKEGALYVSLRDDGRGMDMDKLREEAKKKNIDVNDIIYEPGFSTSEKTTELSGRGYGMGVVKEQLTNLKAKIEFNTELGQGTEFIVIIPIK